jgi:hypothetical protein
MEIWGREAHELGAVLIMRTGHFCLYDLIFSLCFSPVFYGLVRKECDTWLTKGGYLLYELSLLSRNACYV